MTQIQKERLLAVKQQMEQKQKELQQEVRRVFHEEIASIFATYPELTDISWTQYTPYFNDGAECVFHCSGSFYINRFGPDPENPHPNANDYKHYEDREHYFSPYSKTNAPATDAPWEARAAYDMHQIIQALGEPLMKDIFGDHAQIIIGRDKIVVEHYEHD